MATIEGVEIEIGSEAVVVTAARSLTVLSSAVVGGGPGRARAIVNLHVDQHCPWSDGGPISDAGWVVSSATRTALAEGVRRWTADRT